MFKMDNVYYVFIIVVSIKDVVSDFDDVFAAIAALKVTMLVCL